MPVLNFSPGVDGEKVHVVRTDKKRSTRPTHEWEKVMSTQKYSKVYKNLNAFILNLG